MIRNAKYHYSKITKHYKFNYSDDELEDVYPDYLLHPVSQNTVIQGCLFESVVI